VKGSVLLVCPLTVTLALIVPRPAGSEQMIWKRHDTNDVGVEWSQISISKSS
jgi:hypothetical protein